MRFKLTLKKLGPKWWITGDEDCGPMGPYQTCEDAEASRRGLCFSYAEMRESGIINQDEGGE